MIQINANIQLTRKCISKNTKVLFNSLLYTIVVYSHPYEPDIYTRCVYFHYMKVAICVISD